MIELKLEEGEISDFEMVNAKFNTDEYLNELLEVDRHMDYHPGGQGWMHWLAENVGWNDDSDDENDTDEENDTDDSWETIDENGTDEDNEEK